MARALAPPELTGAGEAIRLRDVWFSYNGNGYALKGIDLTIPRGTATVILGPSGSGKTTLLKLINGLLKPTRGSISVLGVHLDRHSARDMRGLIGYIPQQLGLVRSLTALENVLIGALPRIGAFRSLLGVFPAREIERAQELLEMVGIPQKAGEKAYRLSGGERQRVAIARALMQDPAIILADEFLSDVDYARAYEIMELMQGIRSRGVTVVMVLHDLELAAECGERLVVLEEGCKTREGGPWVLGRQSVPEALS